MRYLVLADVHANLEALEAVLAACGDHDSVLCLGDLIDYGPNPNECVERVSALPNLTCLVGNHDLASLGQVALEAFNPQARAAAVWTGNVLSAESRRYLESLKPCLSMGKCFLAHASPREPIWEYLESEVQALLNFTVFEEPLCFVGHTHVPRTFVRNEHGTRATGSVARSGDILDLTDGLRRIANPGGVGQPRDGDPRAAYGMWDTTACTFTFARVEYTVAVTQEKILTAGLPSSLAYRLSAGL